MFHPVSLHFASHDRCSHWYCFSSLCCFTSLLRSLLIILIPFPFQAVCSSSMDVSGVSQFVCGAAHPVFAHGFLPLCLCLRLSVHVCLRTHSWNIWLCTPSEFTLSFFPPSSWPSPGWRSWFSEEQALAWGRIHPSCGCPLWSISVSAHGLCRRWLQHSEFTGAIFYLIQFPGPIDQFSHFVAEINFLRDLSTLPFWCGLGSGGYVQLCGADFGRAWAFFGIPWFRLMFVHVFGIQSFDFQFSTVFYFSVFTFSIFQFFVLDVLQFSFVSIFQFSTSSCLDRQVLQASFVDGDISGCLYGFLSVLRFSDAVRLHFSISFSSSFFSVSSSFRFPIVERQVLNSWSVDDDTVVVFHLFISSVSIFGFFFVLFTIPVFMPCRHLGFHVVSHPIPHSFLSSWRQDFHGSCNIMPCHLRSSSYAVCLLQMMACVGFAGMTNDAKVWLGSACRYFIFSVVVFVCVQLHTSTFEFNFPRKVYAYWYKFLC